MFQFMVGQRKCVKHETAELWDGWSSLCWSCDGPMKQVGKVKKMRTNMQTFCLSSCLRLPPAPGTVVSDQGKSMGAIWKKSQRTNIHVSQIRGGAPRLHTGPLLFVKYTTSFGPVPHLCDSAWISDSLSKDWKLLWIEASAEWMCVNQTAPKKENS